MGEERREVVHRLVEAPTREGEMGKGEGEVVDLLIKYLSKNEVSERRREIIHGIIKVVTAR